MNYGDNSEGAGVVFDVNFMFWPVEHKRTEKSIQHPEQ